MKPHLFRPAAAADIERAYVWYERKRGGLGEEFLAEVFTSVQAVLERLDTFPVLHRKTRRALVRRFPYALFSSGWWESGSCSSPASMSEEIPASGSGAGNG